jgi:HEAT repeat protein
MLRMSELRDYEKETRPSREVAEAVLGFIEEDGKIGEGAPIAALQHRAGKEEFDIGAEYAANADPVHRLVGASVLGQLGWGEQNFREESVDILIPMLEDPDPRVIYHAACGLGYRNDPRAIPFLAALKDHPDAQVRMGAVSGVSSHDDPLAISCLMHLMKDEDRDVRNWATFELGSITPTNSPEICEALFEALDEEDGEIHGEAMVGLAVRGDRRVVSVLSKWWETHEPYGLALEAAEAIADPTLVPPLEKFLVELDEWRNEVVKALESCRAASADF